MMERQLIQLQNESALLQSLPVLLPLPSLTAPAITAAVFVDLNRAMPLNLQ